MNRQTPIRTAVTALAMSVLAGCGGNSSSVVPTSATPTAAAPTTTTPTTPAPAPTPSTPTSVRVECTGSLIHGEKVTCKATAVTPSLTASGDRVQPLLDSDVSRSATWSSSNTTVATVSNGDVEGLGVGSASISATYQGVTGKVDVEVKRNQADIESAAAGRYTTNGHLESNTCPGVTPLSSYLGTVEIEKVESAKRNVTLSEAGGVQRVFRGVFSGNTATGQATFTSDPLPSPFGSSNPVTSSRLTGTFDPNGGATTVREEMTCNAGGGAIGAIAYRIESIKFF